MAPAFGSVTISISGTIASANDGSLYSVGQPVQITFTTLPTLGLSDFDIIPLWQGGFWEPETGGPIWSSVTVSGTTGVWEQPFHENDESFLYVNPFLYVNRPIDMIGVLAGGWTDGVNLFAGGVEMEWVGGELSFADGVIPEWSGADMVENLFPASGTYAASPLTDFNLAFLDGSYYTLGESLLVTITNVPEPASAGMLLLGFGIAGVRRRRK